MNRKHYRYQSIGPIAVLLFMIASLMPACRTVTSNPATTTARAGRFIAQATDMALQMRETTLLDETQATATAQVNLDRLAQFSTWPVVLSDTFDDNANEWVVGKETGDYADATFTITNGVYRWEATPHQGFIWWNHPSIPAVTDFYMSVDSSLLSGPPEAYVGLVMGLTENGDYYVFSLRNTGDYALDKRYNGEWLSLIPWTPASVFIAEDTNHLEAFAENGSFSLFVNGAWVADYEDQTIPSGLCGLAVGIDGTTESAVWEFDNFTVRSLNTEENLNPGPTITP